MPHARTRDEAVKHLITLTAPFTVHDLMARLPGVPQGTLSGLVSVLRAGGALTQVPGQDGTTNGARTYRVTARMPKTLDGARALMVRARQPKRKPHARRRRPVPPAPVQLVLPAVPPPPPGAEEAAGVVARIREWQRKAGILDRLIADLALTPADLQPYEVA